MGLHGSVEHRYSDFLALHAHLVKVFPPPRYHYHEFPVKRRFVLVSERDNVSQERLKHFQLYCTFFSLYPEVWDDPKVQRFFEVPRGMRAGAGSRLASPRGEGKGLVARLRGSTLIRSLSHENVGGELASHGNASDASMDMARSGSDMYLANALGRSGSDLYLAKLALEDDGFDDHSPTLRRKPKGDSEARLRPNKILSPREDTLPPPSRFPGASASTDSPLTAHRGDRESGRFAGATTSVDSPLLLHRRDRDSAPRLPPGGALDSPLLVRDSLQYRKLVAVSEMSDTSDLSMDSPLLVRDRETGRAKLLGSTATIPSAAPGLSPGRESPRKDSPNSSNYTGSGVVPTAAAAVPSQPVASWRNDGAGPVPLVPGEKVVRRRPSAGGSDLDFPTGPPTLKGTKSAVVLHPKTRSAETTGHGAFADRGSRHSLGGSARKSTASRASTGSPRSDTISPRSDSEDEKHGTGSFRPDSPLTSSGRMASLGRAGGKAVEHMLGTLGRKKPHKSPPDSAVDLFEPDEGRRPSPVLTRKTGPPPERSESPTPGSDVEDSNGSGNVVSARPRSRTIERCGTPVSKPGDVSPVFARKNRQVVTVPTTMQANIRVRSLKDFQLHALVGRGGFGSVFLATETETGLVVAVKRMAKRTFLQKAKVDQIKMEVTVLKLARVKQNRWIVQLHYSFQDEHYLYLCMQFCPGGDLRNLMENVEMDERTARAFAAEICMCVHQLHALGYAHRDLKPDNFLISQRGHLKLADFGLAEKGYLPEVRARGQSLASTSEMDLRSTSEYSFIIVYFPPSVLESRKPRQQGIGDRVFSQDALNVALNVPAVQSVSRETSPRTPRRETSPRTPRKGSESSSGGGGGEDAHGGGSGSGATSDGDGNTDDVEDDLETDDVLTLTDDKGRRYKRVKVFVSHSTSAADVIDTMKHKFVIRKQVPYQLVEIALINGHHHERLVKPDELVEQLYASFGHQQYRHKFVFRRLAGIQRMVSRHTGSLLGLTQQGELKGTPLSFTGENVPAELTESRAKLFQVVGSPHYMAKEMLEGSGYESVVDWWSVGCIIYEMLFGIKPFDGPTPEAVFARILRFQGEVLFPMEPVVSPEARDIIACFLRPPAERLGADKGLDEVMTHPFFAGVNWGELQYQEPPFLPELEGPLDTGYFPSADSEVEKYIMQSQVFEASGGSKSHSSLHGQPVGTATSTTAATNDSSAPTTPQSKPTTAPPPPESPGREAVRAEAEQLWSTWDWSWFS